VNETQQAWWARLMPRIEAVLLRLERRLRGFPKNRSYFSTLRSGRKIGRHFLPSKTLSPLKRFTRPEPNIQITSACGRSALDLCVVGLVGVGRAAIFLAMVERPKPVDSAHKPALHIATS